MYYIFFDDRRASFQPLTLTRPVADLRMGVLTIAEKWQMMLKKAADTPVFGYLTATYLAEKYPTNLPVNLLAHDTNIQICYINARALPQADLIDEILQLPDGGQLWKNDILLCCKTNTAISEPYQWALSAENVRKTASDPIIISHIWDIFTQNAAALKADFQLLTQGKTSQPISNTNTIIGDRANIFLAEGATVEAAMLNVKGAPIYIGKNAEIMEGAMIRGGLALGEGSSIKMGTKIYGATTIGPHCKIGGEVSNSVIWGYTNKGHEGFLGNSVLGQWCNIGADTNNSNLKNNYGDVEIWDYNHNSYQNTGLQFCGLFMGDHSKTGINAMFNTGTVVGVSVNFFGADYPPKYIPSFLWGTTADFVPYRLDKALETATRVMERRNLPLSAAEQRVLTYIYEQQAFEQQSFEQPNN
jgi:UDP-N-acetylglucosamine diphosphorylase/glucosamine-1-phosphate N-acetyltransferase